MRSFHGISCDNIAVWVGFQKKDTIVMHRLDFKKPISDDDQGIDDLFSMIVMRSRDAAKTIFNGSPLIDQEELDELSKSLVLDDFYKFTALKQSIDERNLKTVPYGNILFYLNSKTNWSVVANLPKLKILTPTPFLSVLQKHYLDHYPEAVYNHAFSDRKNPLRVYAVEELNDKEIFYFEHIFKEDIPSNSVLEITNI